MTVCELVAKTVRPEAFSLAQSRTTSIDIQSVRGSSNYRQYARSHLDAFARLKQESGLLTEEAEQLKQLRMILGKIGIDAEEALTRDE